MLAEPKTDSWDLAVTKRYNPNLEVLSDDDLCTRQILYTCYNVEMVGVGSKQEAGIYKWTQESKSEAGVR